MATTTRKLPDDKTPEPTPEDTAALADETTVDQSNATDAHGRPLYDDDGNEIQHSHVPEGWKLNHENDGGGISPVTVPWVGY